MARSAKHGRLLPKNTLTTLPGAVCAQWVQCNKSNCRRCPHGPYHYRFWRVGGRLRKAYIRKRDLQAVRQACAAWYREQREAREQQRAIEEAFMWEFREMRAQLRDLYGKYGWKG